MAISTPLVPELHRLADVYDWRAAQAVTEDQENGTAEEWRHLSTVLRAAATALRAKRGGATMIPTKPVLDVRGCAPEKAMTEWTTEGTVDPEAMDESQQHAADTHTAVTVSIRRGWSDDDGQHWAEIHDAKGCLLTLAPGRADEADTILAAVTQRMELHEHLARAALDHDNWTLALVAKNERELRDEARQDITAVVRAAKGIDRVGQVEGPAPVSTSARDAVGLIHHLQDQRAIEIERLEQALAVLRELRDVATSVAPGGSEKRRRFLDAMHRAAALLGAPPPPPPCERCDGRGWVPGYVEGLPSHAESCPACDGAEGEAAR